MRTEVKFAVVVVLVGIIGTAFYFFSRNNEKPFDLTKPSVKTPSPNVDKMPLPLGPGREIVTEKTTPVEVTPTPAAPEVTELTPPKGDQSKPLLKIDLNPLSSAPATRPARTARLKSGRLPRELSAGKLVPNQPAQIELTPLTETTPSREPLASQETTAAPSIHIVKPGETLYQIAKKYYGRGEMWTVIARANKELHPGSLHAGAKLTIPPAGKAKANFDGPVKSEDLPKNVDKSKVKTYTVKSGDSFSTIAREHLGSSSRWKEIFELNKAKIGKPENLRVGQTIYLPGK